MKKIKPTDVEKISRITRKYEDQLYEFYAKKSGLDEKFDRSDEPQDQLKKTGDSYKKTIPTIEPSTQPTFDAGLQRNITTPDTENSYNPYSKVQGGYFDQSNQFFNQGYRDPYSSKFQQQNVTYVSPQIPSRTQTPDTNSYGGYDPYPIRANSPFGRSGFDVNANRNAGLTEEEFKLRKMTELLGGIERTLPTMEKSLQENEIKHSKFSFPQINPLSSNQGTQNQRQNNFMQQNNRGLSDYQNYGNPYLNQIPNLYQQGNNPYSPERTNYSTNPYLTNYFNQKSDSGQGFYEKGLSGSKYQRAEKLESLNRFGQY